MTMSTDRLRSTLSLLFCASLVAAAGCKDDPKGLVIVSPESGSTLTEADDEDPATDGIQFTVRVVAENVPDGDTLGLFYDGSEEPLGTPDDTAVVMDESAEFVVTGTGSQSFDLLVATESLGDLSNRVQVDVIEGCGASVEFVSPAPTGGSVTLGPNDDTTGPGTCDEDFTIDVEVSTDAGEGAMGQLFVNGAPAATGMVSGTVLRFTGVLLPDGANELRVAVTNATGTCDDPSLSTSVTVDCDRPSCAFEVPMTGTAFLSSADDVSGDAGLQTPFEIRSDVDVSGEEVELVVDGDVLTATAMTDGDGSLARFDAVSLEEGLRRVRAVCRDPLGNATAVTAEWTVDTVACGVTVTDPAADTTFIDGDDVDDSTDGVQVNIAATVSGSDCVSASVGICDSALSAGTLDSGSASGVVTLSSSPSQELCVEVEDEAGNVGEGRVAVRVQTDAPQLEVTTPTAGTQYNVEGGDGAIADLDVLTTDFCEANVEVRCSEVGAEVELVRADTAGVLGTATCTEMAGLPAPFTGVATFSSVGLPTVGGGVSYNIFARATVDRLTGTSSPVEIFSDCDPPVFEIFAPECGSVLRPSVDDSSPDPGFQFDVSVSNANVPPPDVELVIRDADSGMVVYTATSTMRTGALNIFPDADFGAGGERTVVASGTDAAGNLGFSEPSCTMNVVDLPSVDIVEPADGSVLSTGDDCDGGTAGLQIRVRASTDAADGSTARVTVGALPTTTTSVSGGEVDVCVDADDGRPMVTVEVEDGRGTGTASATITVDTQPPTSSIDDLAATVVDRRGGTVRFTWTAVADEGGAPLEAYELRCSESPITNETEWDAARVIPVTATPMGGGATETLDLSEFRVGDDLQCVVRGEDIAGALTPIGPAASFAIDFEQLVVPSATQGRRLAAIGDVNGEGVDDFISGGTLFSGGTDSAQLYFGSATALPTTMPTTLTGTSTGFFGVAVAGIGDFNGDGRPDFAIADPGVTSFTGAVYIYFGRASTDPWPATVTTASADVVIGGLTGSGLGVSLAAAGDVNGDGNMDLAIGAQLEASEGRVHVVFGGSATGALTVASDTDGFTITPGAETAASFGYAVTGLGNGSAGDSRVDLAVGALGSASMSIDSKLFTIAYPEYSVGMGMQTVSASLLDATAPQGAPVDRTLFAAGDLDGDGFGELVSCFVGSNDTRPRIYFGSPTGYSAGSTLTINNLGADRLGDFFASRGALGHHPAFGLLGDIDGDDVADLAVGSSEDRALDGSVDIFFDITRSSPTSRDERDLVYRGAGGTDPKNVAYVGDVNGDGYIDLAFEDPGASGVTLLY